MANLVFRPRYDEYYDASERSSFEVSFILEDDSASDPDHPMGRLVFDSDYIDIFKGSEYCDFIYSMFMREFEYRLNVYSLSPLLTSYLEVAILNQKFTVSVKSATPDDVKMTLYILLLVISQQQLPVIEYGQLDNLCGRISLPSDNPQNAAATEDATEAAAAVATTNDNTDTQDAPMDTTTQPPSPVRDDPDSLIWDGLQLVQTAEPIDVDEFQLLDHRNPPSLLPSNTSTTTSTTKSSVSLPDNQSVHSNSTTHSIGKHLRQLNMNSSPKTILRRPVLNESSLLKSESTPLKAESTPVKRETPKVEMSPRKPEVVPPAAPTALDPTPPEALFQFLQKNTAPEKLEEAVHLLLDILTEKAINFRVPEAVQERPFDHCPVKRSLVYTSSDSSDDKRLRRDESDYSTDNYMYDEYDLIDEGKVATVLSHAGADGAAVNLNVASGSSQLPTTIDFDDLDVNQDDFRGMTEAIADYTRAMSTIGERIDSIINTEDEVLADEEYLSQPLNDQRLRRYRTIGERDAKSRSPSRRVCRRSNTLTLERSRSNSGRSNDSTDSDSNNDEEGGNRAAIRLRTARRREPSADSLDPRYDPRALTRQVFIEELPSLSSISSDMPSISPVPPAPADMASPTAVIPPPLPADVPSTSAAPVAMAAPSSTVVLRKTRAPNPPPDTSKKLRTASPTVSEKDRLRSPQ